MPHRAEPEHRNPLNRVFPGIELAFCEIINDNITGLKGKFSEKTLVFYYCYEGRVDWEFESDRHFFLRKGDFSICRPDIMTSGPTCAQPGHNGVLIFVDLNGINTIRPMLCSFRVDLEQLWATVCLNDGIVIRRADSTLKHIFSELNTIPQKIKETYIRLKILELLLFISALDFSASGDTHPYFRKNDIVKVRKIKEYLLDNLDKRIPLSELSGRFEISQTLLKSCFKAVFGVPVSSFVRSCRMQRAGYLLRSSGDSVTDIALKVGYSNSSKFAAAFRAEFGDTPYEYRKKAGL